MVMNSHLHVVVETEFLNKLKDKAKKKMLTVSEYCRLKLQMDLQFDRIEQKLDILLTQLYVHSKALCSIYKSKIYFLMFVFDKHMFHLRTP